MQGVQLVPGRVVAPGAGPPLSLASASSALQAEASTEHLSRWYSRGAVDQSLPTRLRLCRIANIPSALHGVSTGSEDRNGLTAAGPGKAVGRDKGPVSNSPRVSISISGDKLCTLSVSAEVSCAAGVKAQHLPLCMVQRC